MAKRGRKRNSIRAASAARATRRHAARPRKRESGVLLLVLVSDARALEQAVAVLVDLGLAATVLESRPLSTVLRTELPIFSGLASLLPQAPDGRLLVSIASSALADRASRQLSRGEARARPTIVATIGLRNISGLRLK